MRARLVAWLSAACLPAAMLAQQRDVAGTPTHVAGDGEIAGIVIAADGGQPLRRAIVTLAGGAASSRSVLTDEHGRFTFARVPAGTFTVTASKAAYLDAPHGARRPGRLGVPIALAPAQRVTVTIPMFRGAAITGSIRDPAGQPIGGLDVRIIDVRTFAMLDGTTPALRARSDDRGVYRIYGVLPGEYFVVALPSATGEIVGPAAASIDAELAMLASRSGVTPVRPAVAPVSPPPSVGYAPVYFPGSSDHRDAVRVIVAAGEERSGVDFDVRPIPMGSIEGVVSGPVPNLAAVQVSLIPTGPRVSTSMSSVSLAGRPIDAQGSFRYANLAPGPYRVVARARIGDAAAALPKPGGGAAASGGGVASPGGPVTAATDYLYGYADVDVRGPDVTGVALALQPGGSMSGRIVFAGAAPPPPREQIEKMRATLVVHGGTGGSVSTDGLMMGSSIVGSPISVVNPDGTFHIRGIGPGQFRFSAAFAFGSSAGSWKLRAVVAGDRDLLDGPFEVGPGVHLRDVMIMFSDARTELSGALQTAGGVATIDYDIVAFPADRRLWTHRSRRVLSVRPGTDGRFVFTDPPAGEYLIAALRDLDPIDLWDTAFLEQIASSAVRVTVREGEAKVQDLRIR